MTPEELAAFRANRGPKRTAVRPSAERDLGYLEGAHVVEIAREGSNLVTAEYMSDLDLLRMRDALARYCRENGLDCPDGGTCHHQCRGTCFRVQACGPLSGVYPGDKWPDEVTAAHRLRPDDATIEHRLFGVRPENLDQEGGQE